MKQFVRLGTAIVIAFLASGCGGGGGGGAQTSSALCTKIAGGQQCQNSNSPIVLLAFYKRRGVAYCTGTYISLTSVLTAAHCFVGSVRRPDVITSSGISGNTSDEWVTGAWDPRRFDVAQDALILKVDPSIAQAAGITPATLALEADLARGQKISVIGFGLTENAELPDDLLPKIAELEIVSQTGGALSARSVNGATCFGDSGGPALATIKGKTSIVGIVSLGTNNECDSTGLTTFTDTSRGDVMYNLIQPIAPDATLNQ